MSTDPIRAALVCGHCGVREMDAALRAVLDLCDQARCFFVAGGITTPLTCNCTAHTILRSIADALGVAS